MGMRITNTRPTKSNKVRGGLDLLAYIISGAWLSDHVDVNQIKQFLESLVSLFNN